MAKEFLSQKGIVFEDRNITDHPEFIDEMIKTAQGAMATPTILIGDEAFVGFHRQKIEQALGL